MRTAVIAHFVVLAGAWAAAEPLTLEQAMAEARVASREARAAQARSESSSATAAQARGFRLPRVTLSEMWISTDSPAEAFAFRLNQQRFSMAEFMTADPNRPSRMETGMTRLHISLPVYSGGELRGRISQAELMSQAGKLESARAADIAAQRAGEAFVMVAQAREYVALLEKAQQTVASHVDLARQYLEQGMLVRSDVLRAEVELARITDLLLESRGGLEVARANLAFHLGRDQGEPVDVAALPELGGVCPELTELLQSATQRADLVAARRGLQAGELEETVRRAALLPRVGLVVQGDLVDDAPFGTRAQSATVMAVATWDLYAGGSHRAAMAAARWQARAGRLDVERFEEGIAVQVRSSHAAAVAAHARWETAGRAVTAASEAERIVGERFRAGVVKMLDLLDASTALREAETRALASHAEALAARIALASAAGLAPESLLR